jgi:prolyl oligopeptidase PreP (S9A serine peptidase family)
MTDSGYPRSVWEWRRGTPLAEATKVYEGEQSDVSVGGFAYLDRGRRCEFEMQPRCSRDAAEM